MRVLLAMVMFTACSHHHAAAPVEPEKPVEPPTTTPAWDEASGQFLDKLATVMDAAQDDCAKLVAGLKTLEPDAAALAKILVDTNHELAEYVQPAGLHDRFAKHPNLFFKCEGENVDGFSDAVSVTLFTVEPLKEDRKISAFRDIFVPR